MRWRLPPRSGFPLTVAAFAFVFLGLFLAYPLWKVLASSFLDATGTHFSVDAYVKVLTTGYYRSAVTNSLLIGGLVTAASIAIGLPMAFLLARMAIPGRSVLLEINNIGIFLPSLPKCPITIVLLLVHWPVRGMSSP